MEKRYPVMLAASLAITLIMGCNDPSEPADEAPGSDAGMNNSDGDVDTDTDPDSGEPPIEERIIGGNLDNSNTYPYVVSVNGSCTGTLVSPTMVITAAHCVCGCHQDPNGIWIADIRDCNKTAWFEVENTLTGEKTRYQATATVNPSYFHEYRNERCRELQPGATPQGDLAILKSTDGCVKGVTGWPGIPDQPPPDTMSGRTVGYGLTACEGPLPEGRYFGDMSAHSEEGFLRADKIVLGALTAPGDSGGPFLFIDEQGNMFLYGVTSFGTCGRLFGLWDTATFTNVFPHREWINNLIAADDTVCAEDDSDAGSTAVCGNGTVESGEQCDSDVCCANCRFAAAGTICREALDDECDIPETCSGESGVCPVNYIRPNGAICTDGTCEDGACGECEGECCYLPAGSKCGGGESDYECMNGSPYNCGAQKFRRQKTGVCTLSRSCDSDWGEYQLLGKCAQNQMCSDSDISTPGVWCEAHTACL